MARVVVAHQSTGGWDKDWIPWMKKELEKRGFEVVVPADFEKIKKHASYFVSLEYG